MILRDHKRRMASAVLAMMALACAPFATAGEAAFRVAAIAPLNLAHTENLDLQYHARRRSRGNGNLESSALLDPEPGLQPLRWPRNSDLRARLLTPELERTPLVGWIAANLYRSKKENGWCLEVDPGDGEYLVLYRHHLRR
jgi:hypothetical protein